MPQKCAKPNKKAAFYIKNDPKMKTHFCIFLSRSKVYSLVFFAFHANGLSERVIISLYFCPSTHRLFCTFAL